jgi:hypothetical protein
MVGPGDLDAYRRFGHSRRSVHAAVSRLNWHGERLAREIALSDVTEHPAPLTLALTCDCGAMETRPANAPQHGCALRGAMIMSASFELDVGVLRNEIEEPSPLPLGETCYRDTEPLLSTSGWMHDASCIGPLEL